MSVLEGTGMNLDEYKEKDAIGLSDLVRAGHVSASELCEAAIAQIEKHNSCINAVIRTRYDAARAEAKRVDKTLPFAGVPFLVKDLVATIAGEPTGSGNKLRQSIVSQHDSEIVRRYRAAGLVIVGQTNVPEFGITPFTEPKSGGKTRNPWNLNRSAGGSSGGSAAAVAARMTPMASASDGGGSIRIPASCCGLFGFKPSRGMTPLGPDLSEILRGFGIEHALTRSVRDSAAMLDVTYGMDPGAPYAAPNRARPFLDEVSTDPRPLRIAVSCAPLFGGNDVDNECKAAVEATVCLLNTLGHQVEEASPHVDDEDRKLWSRAFVTVLASEVRVEIENAAQLAGRRVNPKDFESTTYALGLSGRSATSYAKALQTLQLATRKVAPFFENYDVLLTPTLARPPIKMCSLQPEPHQLHTLAFINRFNASWALRALNLLDEIASQTFDYIPFTPLFNVTGQPAMSMPLEWNKDGLPIGVQFAAKFGADALLFQLAGQLERAKPWRTRIPPGY
jgi:amidase